MANYFIAGGAGFIGSHLVKAILNQEAGSRVTVYDNFSSGRMRFLDEVKDDPRLSIITADIKQIDDLKKTMNGKEIVYHLASNPDISKAAVEPDIDFWEGTYLTNNILEAMRVNGVRKILYASGSGIYGDAGLADIGEDYSPTLPISTYGASKLAGESLIASYCHMFDMNGVAFRFANVVGRHQTHGVCYDFIRSLFDNPRELNILGDGTQSKSYIGVSDVISALRLLEKKSPDGFSYYNVATLDHITVSEIADIVINVMGLRGVARNYTGGRRGWKGDVPVVRLNSQKIRNLGWNNEYASREVIYNSSKSIYEDEKADRIYMKKGIK